MSEFEMVVQHLKQPEYVHVLLNPLPVYGLAMGVLALAVAWIFKSKKAQTVALIIVIIGSASALLAVKSGHRGYDRVKAISYADAQQWLDVHMERAEDLQYAFYGAALVAAAAIAALWKFPKAATPLIACSLAAAVICLGLGGWISHAGGQVRHSEFRDGPPPHPVEPHEHDH